MPPCACIALQPEHPALRPPFQGQWPSNRLWQERRAFLRLDVEFFQHPVVAGIMRGVNNISAISADCGIGHQRIGGVGRIGLIDILRASADTYDWGGTCWAKQEEQTCT